MKLVGGDCTGDLCYTFFVSKKVPRNDVLSRAELLPKKVRRFGRDLPTDVVELPEFEFQALKLPIAVTDKVKTGTLLSLANIDGTLVGLTCAHVLWGKNQSPIDADPVYLWVEPLSQWVQAGWTIDAIRSCGKGKAGDFGYFDAGTFRVSSPQLQAMSDGMRSALVLDPESPGFDPARLVGTQVTASGASSGGVAGEIFSVYIHGVAGAGISADFLVRASDGSGLTRPGDSGMVWRDSGGRAIGVHALGERVSGPSRFSVAYFMARACRAFSATLIS